MGVIRRIVSSLLLCIGRLGSTDCNTAERAGEDLEQGRLAIQEAAD